MRFRRSIAIQRSRSGLPIPTSESCGSAARSGPGSPTGSSSRSPNIFRSWRTTRAIASNCGSRPDKFGSDRRGFFAACVLCFEGGENSPSTHIARGHIMARVCANRFRSALTMAAAGLLLTTSATAYAQSAEPRMFNIPSGQDLATALNSYAAQSGAEIMFAPGIAHGKRANAVSGRRKPADALRLLLSGTGLTFRTTRANTFLVEAPQSGRPAQNASPTSADEGSEGRNREIVVTANKRKERIVEVAGSVSAVTGDQLQDMGAQSLTDYITKLPGVHFNDYTPGRSEVVIRGISTTTYHDFSQPVVGYYINDIPLTESGFPVLIPDVDPFDLQRVEVLRGPQGSLFGSASLGGAINYIVNEADTAKLDSAIELSIGSTKYAGGNVNHTAKAMVNVPLITDVLAVRAVAYQRSDAGYIDNIQLGTRDVNDVRVRGLRGSLVFTPSETTSITLSSMIQKLESDYQPYVVLGTYDKRNAVPDPAINRFQLYSARLDQDLGFATLIVLGSRSIKDGLAVYDQSAEIPLFTGFGGVAFENIAGRARSWYGEARLASKGEGAFRWLVGTNYASSTNALADEILQPGLIDYIDANPALYGNIPGATFAPGNRFFANQGDQRNKDFGLFGEIGFKPVPEIELIAGGRYYDTSSDGVISRFPDAVGSLFGTPPTRVESKQSASGLSPTASIAFRPNRDLTVYAKYAKGFRVGGPNPKPPGVADLPAVYEADSVQNYEVGVHAVALGRRLSVDAAIYRIDWNNIQTRQFTPQGFAYVANGGGARSEGVEFSGSFRVIPELTLSSAVSYQDARLTEFLPSITAENGQGGYPAGARLPGSSKWTVSNNAVLSFDDAPWAPSLAISHRYLSKAPVSFEAPLQRGGYSLFDARLAVKTESNLSLMLYVNNIFNKYGLLSAPFSGFVQNPQGTATRPRTIGLRLNWEL
ncbi:MAG: TonB-dependent receptor [Sphingomonadales bacterium]|nr:MAG: TonB-dependent receptor [Sphingomonadales bacterium]